MDETKTKELTIRDSLKPLTVTTEKIDNILRECVPLMQSVDRASIHESLIIAKGVDLLRQEFQKSEAIKATVLAMCNSKIGFLTDRSPAVIKKSKVKGNKELKPYTYEEITECVIEGLMKNFRLSNNEWNIIAYNFYPAKAGKFRHIIEHPGISNFRFYNGLPKYEIRSQLGYGNKIDKIEYAEIECFASYNLNSELFTIGRTEKNPGDKILFRIRVNRGSLEDAVVGKAHSKLFTRVLYRLTGQLLPESEDITIPPALEAPEETKNLTKQIIDRDLDTKPDETNETEEKEKLIQQLKEKLDRSGIPPLEFRTYARTEKFEDISINDLRLFVNEFDVFVREFNQQIDQDLAEDQ